MAPRYVARPLDKKDRGSKGPVYRMLHLVDENGNSIRVVGGLIMFKQKVFAFADDRNPEDMICNEIYTIEDTAKFTYWGTDAKRVLSRVKPYLARTAA